jgi:SAM-dependent methyltransferase
MPTMLRQVRDDRLADDDAPDGIATIYSRAGKSYAAYADGDTKHLFCFEGPHAYADRCVWSTLETKLTKLRATGASSISILDAGCGPGTWLRRLVSRARALGFGRIVARGFDVAEAQIETARLAARDLAELPGVDLAFRIGDLTAPLPEASGSVDIALCLYGVLCHLPVPDLPKVAAELARVTRGHLITTVRPVGSLPSIFVDSIERARHFQLDHAQDQCKVELCDGRRFTLPIHLFGASELRGCFAERFVIEDLRGLDLFHSRFAPDPRWNPASLPANAPSSARLALLEEAYSRAPGFIERATHLLLVGRSRHASKRKLT